MDKIYICSPYRGDVKENVRHARQYCFCSMLDGMPIAPHLYSTQFLHDACESVRDRGISWGLQLLAECKEIRVFADEVSDGMVAEIQEAKAFHSRD